MEQKTKTKIIVILFIVFLLFGLIGSSFAYNYIQPYTNYNMKFPIQVTPKINGHIQPNTDFDYTFVFAKDVNCVQDLYTKSVTITTDDYGTGAVELNLSTLTDIPKYLCEYRNGNLRKAHPLNERLFLKQINEQDIINMGFIKTDTNTQLNESQVDAYVSNNGYLTNETDPSVTLQKLQNLTLNDFHNLGGIDRVLNKTEISNMGFLLNETDYCKNGVCNGDLTINGDLTLIGSITNVNATNVSTNGSIIPDYDNVFDLGSGSKRWSNVYATNLFGILDYSYLINVPNFLLNETDPKILSTNNNKWCRGTGTQIACDVIPVVDTKLTEQDVDNYVSNNGYLTNETDPIFTSSPSHTITNNNISNWNEAYSWGDHRNFGYITDPDDAVDSNELDNICNQNGLILKRINGTWGCGNSTNFIPTTLLNDYNFTDNSNQWNQVYNDYYSNANGYLTNETDPIYNNDKQSIVFNQDTINWDKNASDDFDYQWSSLLNIPNGFADNIDNDTQLTEQEVDNYVSNNGYLTNETDPIYNNDKSNIVFNQDTTNWDKNASDDFSGNWLDLLNIPLGFLDGIDNDTKYYNLSEFVNDVGYLTNFTELDPLYSISPVSNITQNDIDNWNNVYNQVNNGENSSLLFESDTTNWDKNASDDFSGDWNDLNGVPNGFADNIDNDTHLTEQEVDNYVSNNGYLTTETDPLYQNSVVSNITQNDINNWNNIYYGNHSNYNPNIIHISDEFISYSTENGEIGSLGWGVRHDRGADTYYEDYMNQVNNKHIGQLVCSVDDRTNSGCRYTLGEHTNITGNERFGAIIYNTEKQYIKSRIGLGDYVSRSYYNIDNGIYFKVDDTNDNIQGVVSVDGVDYTCDTGVIATDYTWFKEEFIVNNAGTGVSFYVNDILRCNIQHIPNDVVGPKLLFYTKNKPYNEIDAGKVDLVYIDYLIDGNRFD